MGIVLLYNPTPLLNLLCLSKILQFCFNPLALWARPLYRYATPHNATGHGREEGEIQSISFAKIHVYPHRFNIGGEVVK